jgi:hypothetical protein
MTTIAERRRIAKLVLTINNETVIDKIKSLLAIESKTAKENHIKKYNKEISEAEERIEKGEFYTAEQANVLLAKWQKEVLSGIKKPGATL